MVDVRVKEKESMDLGDGEKTGAFFVNKLTKVQLINYNYVNNK